MYEQRVVYLRARQLTRGSDGLLGNPYFFTGIDGSAILDTTTQTDGVKWIEIMLDNDGTTYAFKNPFTGMFLLASPGGKVSANAEEIGETEKWTSRKSQREMDKEEIRAHAGGDKGGSYRYYGLMSSHGKYLSCRKEGGSLIVAADQLELNSNEHWIWTGYPLQCRFSNSAIPDSIVPEVIKSHHAKFRFLVFNNNDKIATYTRSFKNIVENYDRSLQDSLEWNVFYEKLKVLHCKRDVFLQVPKEDALVWEQLGSFDTMKHFEEECDINSYDLALPLIMAEYEHRGLLPIISENYNFNTYRKLAISIAMKESDVPMWYDPEIPQDMLFAMITFVLQFCIILLVLYSFFDDNEEGEFGVNFDFDSKQWTEYLALVSLVMYMVAYFLYVEWKQLSMTGSLVQWKWTNVGLLLDFFVNFFLYFVIILIQIGVMLHEGTGLNMVANSVALLFLTGIDDELSNLTDEQEKDAIVSLVATRIFETYEEKKKDRRSIYPHMNPDLSNISSYIIPLNEWDGSNPVNFGFDGKWREKNWQVEALKCGGRYEAMKVTHSDTRKPIFAGPASSFCEQQGYSADKGHGIAFDGKNSVYLTSESTSTAPKFEIDLVSSGKVYPDHFFVIELKKAKEIVLLRSTSDGRMCGGLFLVKDFE